MNEDEIYRVAMARIAADHNYQCASFWYLTSVVLVVLLGAAVTTARVYQMRSDRNLRRHDGVYSLDWRP